MGLLQPPIPPLRPGIDLSGQTAIVTGATSGIGLAIARRLLKLKVSNLVLAVRDVSKGETVKASLLEDSDIQSTDARANIRVMHLDTETYANTQAFASSFKESFGELHLLMLNAGSVLHQREMSSTGHEKTVQVMYLSNVLLMLELLPLLEKTAAGSGRPSRVTWTGSRTYRETSLTLKPFPKNFKGAINHFDNATDVALFNRYADSKLLGFLFLRELPNHYDHDKVIINSFCPGNVKTDMASSMPFYIRIPAKLLMNVKGRTPDEGATVALHAALVAGAESHGAFFEDCTVVPVSEFVQSKEGQRVQRSLWNETVAEMESHTRLPSWMTRLN